MGLAGFTTESAQYAHNLFQHHLKPSGDLTSIQRTLSSFDIIPSSSTITSPQTTWNDETYEPQTYTIEYLKWSNPHLRNTIVAGKNGEVNGLCWTEIIHWKEVGNHQRLMFEGNGMPLWEIFNRCEVFEEESTGEVVVRNKRGKYFAFSITLVAPASDGVDTVLVVHATPIEKTL